MGRLRKKIPRGSVMNILNTPLNQLGLSIALISSLKILELKNLAGAKLLIEEDPSTFKSNLGFSSLQELKRIFRKNHIRLPQDF